MRDWSGHRSEEKVLTVAENRVLVIENREIMSLLSISHV